MARRSGCRNVPRGTAREASFGLGGGGPLTALADR